MSIDFSEFGDEEFDPSLQEASKPRDNTLLVPGKYKAEAVKADMALTTNGQGKMLVLEWDLLDDEFKGRKMWSRLNLANPSAEAVRIARADLTAIFVAVKAGRAKSTDAILHRPLILTITVRPEREDNGKKYPPSNEVRGYEAVEAVPNYAPPAVATQSNSPSVASTMPAQSVKHSGAKPTGKARPWDTPTQQ